MSIPFFLYRRLGRWVTCEFNLFERFKISLSNKYEVASFKDVFCHPFYWQVFQCLKEPPKLIVDCGGHCGHFSILAEICIRSKFDVSNTKYILVEPNPHLISVIRKNVTDACITERVHIEQGLLGPKSGSSTLWIDNKNYLATGLYKNKGSKPYEIPYIDLSKIVKDRVIDIMKIDIEGGEFQFIPENLDLLKVTNLVVMELHEASNEIHLELLEKLKSVGLHVVYEPLKSNGQQLIILKR